MARQTWLSSLSPQGLTQYRRDCRERLDQVALRDVDTGEIIKKAPNAFALYTSDMAKLMTGRGKGSFEQVARRWAVLPDSEKDVSDTQLLDLTTILVCLQTYFCYLLHVHPSVCPGLSC